MKISIVMPAYNARQYIRQTVDSVLAQTYQDWELVIVDDGSTDDTPDIVRDYHARDRRVRLVQQANARTARARNRGVAEADPASEFFIFFDSDDLWETYTLETLAGALQREPKIGAAHGLVRFIDGDGRPVVAERFLKHREGDNRFEIIDDRVALMPSDKPTNFSSLLISSFITPGQVLIRRPVMEAVGPWDPTFLIVDDYNLWLRMAQLTDFVFVEKVVVAYRIHANNWSHRPEPLFKEFVALMLKNMCSPDISDENRRKVIVASLFHLRGIITTRLVAEPERFDVMMKHSGVFAEELLKLTESPQMSEEIRDFAQGSARQMLNEMMRLIPSPNLSDEHRRAAFTTAKMLKERLAGKRQLVS